MAFLPGEPIAMEIPLLFFLPAEEGRGRPYAAVRDFVVRIRAELLASVENQVLGGPRTNVVLKLAAGRIVFVRPDRELSRRSKPVAGWIRNTALHTGQSRCGLELCNSAAGSSFANLTRALVKLFFIGVGRHGR